MPRIAGVDIPDNKRVDISLTYIFGIGTTISSRILKNASIDPSKKTKDLSDSDVSKIRQVIESEFLVEGELRVEIQNNIKRLGDINSYRGNRNRKKIPYKSKRTKSNDKKKKRKKGNAIEKKKLASK